MARVTAGLLKHASGKIEGKVFRVMNGNTFVSNRPAHYNKSNSAGAIARRTKFAAVIEFSKYINSIASLKSIWKSAKIKGTTSFNRLVKYNSQYTGEKSPTIRNIITPSENVPAKYILSFPIQALHFSKEAGIIKIITQNNAQLFEFNKNYDLIFILMPLDPKRKKNKYFQLEHIEMLHHLSIDLTEINIELDNTALTKLNRYKKLIIYFSALHEVCGKLKYTWTNTYAKEFDLTLS